jgi:hypothetical protein
MIRVWKSWRLPSDHHDLVRLVAEAGRRHVLVRLIREIPTGKFGYRESRSGRLGVRACGLRRRPVIAPCYLLQKVLRFTGKAFGNQLLKHVSDPFSKLAKPTWAERIAAALIVNKCNLWQRNSGRFVFSLI